MATTPSSSFNPLRFDKTITLGTIIQIVMIILMGLVGYVTIQNNQVAQARELQEQRDAIQSLSQREEDSAQLGARQAAILDQIEHRVSRIENDEDRRDTTRNR
jgi:uncharacterized protein HemX